VGLAVELGLLNPDKPHWLDILSSFNVT
jgi:hypothetical protein